jgi:hypothetical protein
MLLLTPLWLLALLPWTALVAWALVRRGRTVAVPFVQLWPVEAAPAKRRGWRAPPAAVTLLLVAMLLAIVAAAGPALRGERREVGVVIDRGASMSVDARYRPTGDAVLAALADDGLVPRLIAVPDYPANVDRLAALPPTAVDTRSLLNAAVADARARFGGAVVVVTDQDVAIAPGEGLARVSPQQDAPRRVAITHVAARATPRPQVMVRLRNDSDGRAADVTITSAGQTTTRRIDLPAGGSSGDAFLDVPALGDSVDIAIGDGQRLGERAFLARRSPWSRVRAVGPVPTAIARIVAAYGRARPPLPESDVLTVTTDERAAAPPAILVGRGTGDRLAGAVRVTSHPLADDINWPALIASASVHGEPPAGYRPLVSVGERPVLAIDSTIAADGPRRIWIGLHAPAEAQSTDWPVLWTRLFDQLGQTNEGGPYATRAPRQLGVGWTLLVGDATVAARQPGYWPGLYAHADGRRLAINAPDVPPRVAPTSANWLDQVAASQSKIAGTSLAPVFLLLALVLLTIASWMTRAASKA